MRPRRSDSSTMSETKRSRPASSSAKSCRRSVWRRRRRRRAASNSCEAVATNSAFNSSRRRTSAKSRSAKTIPSKNSTPETEIQRSPYSVSIGTVSGCTGSAPPIGIRSESVCQSGITSPAGCPTTSLASSPVIASTVGFQRRMTPGRRGRRRRRRKSDVRGVRAFLHLLVEPGVVDGQGDQAREVLGERQVVGPVAPRAVTGEERDRTQKCASAPPWARRCGVPPARHRPSRSPSRLQARSRAWERPPQDRSPPGDDGPARGALLVDEIEHAPVRKAVDDELRCS